MNYHTALINPVLYYQNLWKERHFASKHNKKDEINRRHSPGLAR